MFYICVSGVFGDFYKSPVYKALEIVLNPDAAMIWLRFMTSIRSFDLVVNLISESIILSFDSLMVEQLLVLNVAILAILVIEHETLISDHHIDHHITRAVNDEYLFLTMLSVRYGYSISVVLDKLK